MGEGGKGGCAPAFNLEKENCAGVQARGDGIKKTEKRSTDAKPAPKKAEGQESQKT